MIVISFIVLATVITIVNYDCKTFIAQATGVYPLKKFWSKFTHSFLFYNLKKKIYISVANVIKLFLT
jgi:hypothetical protein